ncbi:hypothetical protein HK100_007990 [Physocladia obscura]|uniref:CAP-Gly domain-containing protein n=1 Tax=Physocladia obscura TaxID=109957 RepID=A0AAD5T4E7_9FUNG|nr:hypothetical protein HK100_007990 [Physocladia obscura]
MEDSAHQANTKSVSSSKKSSKIDIQKSEDFDHSQLDEIFEKELTASRIDEPAIKNGLPEQFSHQIKADFSAISNLVSKKNSTHGSTLNSSQSSRSISVSSVAPISQSNAKQRFSVNNSTINSSHHINTIASVEKPGKSHSNSQSRTVSKTSLVFNGDQISSHEHDILVNDQKRSKPRSRDSTSNENYISKTSSEPNIGTSVERNESFEKLLKSSFHASSPTVSKSSSKLSIGSRIDDNDPAIIELREIIKKTIDIPINDEPVGTDAWAIDIVNQNDVEEELDELSYEMMRLIIKEAQLELKQEKENAANTEMSKSNSYEISHSTSRTTLDIESAATGEKDFNTFLKLGSKEALTEIGNELAETSLINTKLDQISCFDSKISDENNPGKNRKNSPNSIDGNNNINLKQAEESNSPESMQNELVNYSSKPHSKPISLHSKLGSRNSKTTSKHSSKQNSKIMSRTQSKSHLAEEIIPEPESEVENILQTEGQRNEKPSSFKKKEFLNHESDATDFLHSNSLFKSVQIQNNELEFYKESTLKPSVDDLTATVELTSRQYSGMPSQKQSFDSINQQKNEGGIGTISCHDLSSEEIKAAFSTEFKTDASKIGSQSSLEREEPQSSRQSSKFADSVTRTQVSQQKSAKSSQRQSFSSIKQQTNQEINETTSPCDLPSEKIKADFSTEFKVGTSRVNSQPLFQPIVSQSSRQNSNNSLKKAYIENEVKVNKSHSRQNSRTAKNDEAKTFSPHNSVPSSNKGSRPISAKTQQNNEGEELNDQSTKQISATKKTESKPMSRLISAQESKNASRFVSTTVLHYSTGNMKDAIQIAGIKSRTDSETSKTESVTALSQSTPPKSKVNSRPISATIKLIGNEDLKIGARASESLVETQPNISKHQSTEIKTKNSIMSASIGLSRNFNENSEAEIDVVKNNSTNFVDLYSKRNSANTTHSKILLSEGSNFTPNSISGVSLNSNPLQTLTKADAANPNTQVKISSVLKQKSNPVLQTSSSHGSLHQIDHLQSDQIKDIVQNQIFELSTETVSKQESSSKLFNELVENSSETSKCKPVSKVASNHASVIILHQDLELQPEAKEILRSSQTEKQEISNSNSNSKQASIHSSNSKLVPQHAEYFAYGQNEFELDEKQISLKASNTDFSKSSENNQIFFNGTGSSQLHSTIEYENEVEALVLEGEQQASKFFFTQPSLSKSNSVSQKISEEKPIFKKSSIHASISGIIENGGKEPEPEVSESNRFSKSTSIHTSCSKSSLNGQESLNSKAISTRASASNTVEYDKNEFEPEASQPKQVSKPPSLRGSVSNASLNDHRTVKAKSIPNATSLRASISSAVENVKTQFEPEAPEIVSVRASLLKSHLGNQEICNVKPIFQETSIRANVSNRFEYDENRFEPEVSEQKKASNPASNRSSISKRSLPSKKSISNSTSGRASISSALEYGQNQLEAELSEPNQASKTSSIRASTSKIIPQQRKQENQQGETYAYDRDFDFNVSESFSKNASQINLGNKQKSNQTISQDFQRDDNQIFLAKNQRESEEFNYEEFEDTANNATPTRHEQREEINNSQKTIKNDEVSQTANVRNSNRLVSRPTSAKIQRNAGEGTNEYTFDDFDLQYQTEYAPSDKSSIINSKRSSIKGKSSISSKQASKAASKTNLQGEITQSQEYEFDKFTKQANFENRNYELFETEADGLYGSKDNNELTECNIPAHIVAEALARTASNKSIKSMKCSTDVLNSKYSSKAKISSVFAIYTEVPSRAFKRPQSSKTKSAEKIEPKATGYSPQQSTLASRPTEINYVTLVSTLRREISNLRKEMGIRDDAIVSLKEKEHDLRAFVDSTKSKGKDLIDKNTRILLDRQKKAYQILVAKLRQEIRRLNFQKNSLSDPLIESKYFPYLPRTPHGTSSRTPPLGVIGNLPHRSSDYFPLNPPPPTGNHIESGNRWWWGSGPDLSSHSIRQNSASNTGTRNGTVPEGSLDSAVKMPLISNRLQQLIDDYTQSEARVGDRGCVLINGERVLGMVKYVGLFDPYPESGLWCGIKLDRPLGKHDGVVRGKRYFSCEENHGLFVKLEKIIPMPRETTGGKKNVVPHAV